MEDTLSGGLITWGYLVFAILVLMLLVVTISGTKANELFWISAAVLWNNDMGFYFSPLITGATQNIYFVSVGMAYFSYPVIGMLSAFICLILAIRSKKESRIVACVLVGVVFIMNSALVTVLPNGTHYYGINGSLYIGTLPMIIIRIAVVYFSLYSLFTPKKVVSGAKLDEIEDDGK